MFSNVKRNFAPRWPLFAVERSAVGELGVKVERTPGTALLRFVVTNALAEYGSHHIDMPATPERVWRAIRDTSN